MQNLYFDEMDWSQKKVILFCVPYGGGWSTMFHVWEKYMDERIAIIPVKFPGRGERMDEESFPDMEQLVEDITPVVDTYHLPMFFYGGCFGGLCSYEIIKKLEQDFQRKVEQFFTNSLISPRMIGKDRKLSNYPDDLLVEELLKRGELPQEILGDKEVLQFLLPGIRADYQIYEEYQYKQKGKIHTDFCMFYKEEADMLSKKYMDWSNLIDGVCTKEYIPCHNLFDVESQIEIAKRINKKLIFFMIELA